MRSLYVQPQERGAIYKVVSRVDEQHQNGLLATWSNAYEGFWVFLDEDKPVDGVYVCDCNAFYEDVSWWADSR
jgi:hypothetical protein